MGNKSDIRNMLKDAGILFLITLIAGLVLGFIYELTKDPIKRQQELAIQKACKAVFEQAHSFSQLDYLPGEELANELSAQGVTVGKAYVALDEARNILGYVVESTSSKGYGGNITLYVGVTSDGMLNDISILEIKETPGLGMNAGKVLKPQFHNKYAEEFTYTKNGSQSDSEIDAISGATVTTGAVVNAVNGGLKAVLRELSVMDVASMILNSDGEGGHSNE